MLIYVFIITLAICYGGHRNSLKFNFCSTTGARDPLTSALQIVLGKRVNLDVAQIVRWKMTPASISEPCVRYAASFAGYSYIISDLTVSFINCTYSSIFLLRVLHVIWNKYNLFLTYLLSVYITVHFWVVSIMWKSSMRILHCTYITLLKCIFYIYYWWLLLNSSLS